MSGLGTPAGPADWERFLDALEHRVDDPLAHAAVSPQRPVGPIPAGLVGRAEELLGRCRATEDGLQRSLADLRRQLRVASDGQRRLAHLGPRPATLDITV